VFSGPLSDNEQHNQLCVFITVTKRWRYKGVVFKMLNILHITGFLLLLLGCIAVLHSTYIDVTCCYRPSSVVCQSGGLSVTLVSPAKMAEPIEILLGLRTLVGPGNHVLDGGPDPSHGKG